MSDHSPPTGDPYATLGVPRQASTATIRRAYHLAVKATHPDVAGDSPQAGQRLRALTEAWATLRDPRRRAAFDAAHPVTVTDPQPSTATNRLAEQRRAAQQRRTANLVHGAADREAFSFASRRIAVFIVAAGFVALIVTLALF